MWYNSVVCFLHWRITPARKKTFGEEIELSKKPLKDLEEKTKTV